MSLRTMMTFLKGNSPVKRLMVPAGYTEYKTRLNLIDAAIKTFFHTEWFIEKQKMDPFPTWSKIVLFVPDEPDAVILKSQFANVEVWNDLLRAGVEPDHVIKNAKNHLESLKALNVSAYSAEDLAELHIACLVTKNFITFAGMKYELDA